MQRLILNIAHDAIELEQTEVHLKDSGLNVITISSLEENLPHCLKDLHHSDLHPQVIVCNVRRFEDYVQSYPVNLPALFPNAKLILVANTYDQKLSGLLKKSKSIFQLLLYRHLEVELSYVISRAFNIHQLETKNREMEARLEFEQYRYDRTLKERIQVLQEKLTAKNRFIAILAHDLKSAFNNLTGFSDILMTDYENLDKDTRLRFIAKIKNLSENTFKLLKNILRWNEAQKGSLKPSPRRISVFDFMNELIDLYQPHALNKGLRLASFITEEFEIYADKNMMSTLFRNLIANAIKFTPPNGEIIIRAAEINDEIHIQVEDTGVGIPDMAKDKLFRIDEKISTPGTSNESGTGLGLLLCKEMAELNEGTINVESTVGHGSKFTVQFPKVLKQELSTH